MFLVINADCVYAQTCGQLFLSTTDAYAEAFAALKKMPTLVMDHDNRTAMYSGNIKERAKQLGAYVDKSGKLAVNGEPLSESGWYTGVVLKDGSILIGPRENYLHYELVTPRDKVVAAFEIRGGRGKMNNGYKFIMSNQSGTYKPSYQAFLKSLELWGVLHNTPENFWNEFRLFEFKN